MAEETGVEIEEVEVEAKFGVKSQPIPVLKMGEKVVVPTAAVPHRKPAQWPVKSDSSEASPIGSMDIAESDLLVQVPSAGDRGIARQSATKTEDVDLWELYHQLELLDDEVRQLRGQLEKAYHELELLKKQQTRRYLDLDERINRLAGLSDGTVVQRVSPTLQKGSHTTKAVSRVQKPSVNTAAGSAITQKQRYEILYKALENKDFVQAEQGFEQFIKDFPAASLTANALYWLAELALRSKPSKEPLALTYLERVLTEFPDHGKVPDVLYKKAILLYRQDKTTEAVAIFESLQSSYPDTTAARLAEHQLKRLQKAVH